MSLENGEHLLYCLVGDNFAWDVGFGSEFFGGIFIFLS